MEQRVVRCSCGAAGDEGEMVVHFALALSDPEDTRSHTWQGGPEPQPVTAERRARARRDDTRRKLAQAAGVSVDELREALRS